jgi:hypothetical protein
MPNKTKDSPKQILLKFTDAFKEHRTDLSAILLTPDKRLWLGSDETSTIERLSYVDENTFGEHKHYRVSEFIDLPAPEEQEIDIEGFTYCGNYLWFTGSHSFKRKKPKPELTDAENVKRLAKVATEPNRYIIGRIPLVGGELYKSIENPADPKEKLTAAKLEVNKQGNALMTELKEDPHIGYFVGAPIAGKSNGFDIEGIAIYQDRIFLGLRGPVLRGWAVIIEIELKEADKGLLKLKKIGEDGARYKKHFINLKGLGIRDLYLDGEDLLILAGPTMDLSGPVYIFRWRDGVKLPENGLHSPELVQPIPFGDKEDHAEGITLLNGITEKPSLLIVYDSPANSRLVGDDSIVTDVFELKG